MCGERGVVGRSKLEERRAELGVEWIGEWVEGGSRPDLGPPRAEGSPSKGVLRA